MSLMDVARGAYVRSPEVVRRSLAPLVSLVPTRLKFGGNYRQWRERIALAGATALALVVAMRSPAFAQAQGWAPLRRLGKISYSVFLVHFSVCLLVNAVESHFWPQSIPAALLGMCTAFVLSIAAGHLLYERVERHVPSWHMALRWQAVCPLLLLAALVVGFGAFPEPLLRTVQDAAITLDNPQAYLGSVFPQEAVP